MKPRDTRLASASLFWIQKRRRWRKSRYKALGSMLESKSVEIRKLFGGLSNSAGPVSNFSTEDPARRSWLSEIKQAGHQTFVFSAKTWWFQDSKLHQNARWRHVVFSSEMKPCDTRLASASLFWIQKRRRWRKSRHKALGSMLESK